MTARKIDFYLNASDGLRSLAQEARQIAELDRVLAQAAPEGLTQACRVKQLRDGTLTLWADNAAVAAKLKQLTARLLAAYRKLRSEVTSIRIEVQVGGQPAAVQKDVKKSPLSIETIGKFDELANSMEDGPLKQALTKLADHQRPPD